MMSGIGSIVLTALSFYAAGNTQKTAFGATALMALFIAFFQAWKNEHLAADKREVTFEIDGKQSLVRLEFGEARKTKSGSTPGHVELSLRMRFVNQAVHQMLIRKVHAQLMLRKRLGIAKPVDEFIASVPTEITGLLEQNGLSLPGQSLSDYHVFIWSARMPVDFMLTSLLLECFVRIDMYALNQRPLRMDFNIGDWEKGVGRLQTRIE